MSGPVRTVIGFVGGAVAFVLLSYAEGVRGSALVTSRPGFALAVAGGALVAVALVSSVFLLGRRFGVGVIVSLGVLLLAGAATGTSAGAAANDMPLPVPDLLARGAGSIAAWSTLGVVAVLVLAGRCRGERRESTQTPSTH